MLNRTLKNARTAHEGTSILNKETGVGKQPHKFVLCIPKYFDKEKYLWFFLVRATDHAWVSEAIGNEHGVCTQS